MHCYIEEVHLTILIEKTASWGNMLRAYRDNLISNITVHDLTIKDETTRYIWIPETAVRDTFSIDRATRELCVQDTTVWDIFIRDITNAVIPI